MGYTQWSELHEGSGFTPAGRTVTAIKPGYYDLAMIEGQVFFVPVRARTDELLAFPDSASKDVLEGIRAFWQRKDRFRQFGITYKRGVLLYGPPGSGKTSTLQLIARDLVNLGGLVLTYNAKAFLGAYRALRDIQPDIPVAVLMEDFEEQFTNTTSKSALLNLLDGVEALDNVVFLATCFTPNTRFLAADLRWVPCGDLIEGDEIWAFDESSPPGRGARRRLRKAVVTRSHRARKECVRVTMDTGESYVCTTDHPWLTFGKNGYRANTMWTQAKDLLGHQLIRPFRPWEEEFSYVDAHVYLRRGTRDKQQIIDTRGGLASALSLLGRVRPERLIARVDLTGAQMLNKFPSRVVSVESVGVQEIQSIETSTGTYIAEGFATHNTNYPEKLEPRIVNRPSRFDQVLRVPHPSGLARRMYLEALVATGGEHNLISIDRYVTDTEGFSLAHVKELFISDVVLGQSYRSTLRRLKDMQENKLTSLDDNREASEPIGSFL